MVMEKNSIRKRKKERKNGLFPSQMFAYEKTLLIK